MPKTIIAYCGISCDKCPVFIATSKGDDALREKTAKEWSNLYANILESFGIHSLKPEDMNCSGCRSERGLFIGCASCPIRKCSQNKGFITCASCDEYESCGMLNAFYSNVIHKSAKENLDSIRMKR